MKSISCREAVEYILKKEEGRLSLLQRMRLWQHLAICSLCKIFSIQNGMINEAMKKRQNKPLALSQDEKEKIIRNVLSEKNF